MSSDDFEPIRIWLRHGGTKWCFFRPADDDYWTLVEGGPSAIAERIAADYGLADDTCLDLGYDHLAGRMKEYRDVLDGIGVPYDIDFPGRHGNGDGCWGFGWNWPGDDVADWYSANRDAWATTFTRVFGPAALFRGEPVPPFDLTDPTAILVCADWLEERGDVRRATLCRQYGTRLVENGLPVMTREAGRLDWNKDGRPVVTRIEVKPWREPPPLPPPDPDGLIRIPF